jgi:glycogen synthase
MKLTTNFALALYKKPAIIKKLVKNAMHKNNNWHEAGKKYLALYHSVVK